MGPYLEQIAQIIEENRALPKKQRHTAKRIYERIQAMGYDALALNDGLIKGGVIMALYRYFNRKTSAGLICNP
jgi:hypothetical protein